MSADAFALYSCLSIKISLVFVVEDLFLELPLNNEMCKGQSDFN